MIGVDVIIGISVAVVFASIFINAYSAVISRIRARIVDKVISNMPCSDRDDGDWHFVEHGFLSYPIVESDGKSYIKGFCNLHDTSIAVLLTKKETRRIKKDYKISYKKGNASKGDII